MRERERERESFGGALTRLRHDWQRSVGVGVSAHTKADPILHLLAWLQRHTLQFTTRNPTTIF